MYTHLFFSKKWLKFESVPYTNSRMTLVDTEYNAQRIWTTLRCFTVILYLEFPSPHSCSFKFTICVSQKKERHTGLECDE